MKIEIKQTENPILHYQVRISESLPPTPKTHAVERVTISPQILTFEDAEIWLIKWLRLQVRKSK